MTTELPPVDQPSPDASDLNAAAPSSGSTTSSPEETELSSPPSFDSQIISKFPAILSEFHSKWFSLLWRGSRDGFGAKAFHNQCDGHPNVLIVILDTDRNIFGGFTPLQWECFRSRQDVGRADESPQNFIFTLKNPHNFPARKFPLTGRGTSAIRSDADRGPCFMDIKVSSRCNANTKSKTSGFGHSCANDTGLNGETFFTGSKHFRVKEIEVFEITDSSPPPRPPIQPLVGSLDSRILSDFPEIFAEFRGKTFSLLFRGSRDGFAPAWFHLHCDGHANTLTVILSSNGNIFGGFTPVEWESAEPEDFTADMTDENAESFLFTLKNPHGLPARKFPLRAEEKHQAIKCMEQHGIYLVFGDADLVVGSQNSQPMGAARNFGEVYINDTELDGSELFTGSKFFKVKDIEVFDITDFEPTASPPSTPSLDSQIISDFPEIFAEFRGKQFSLLFRGSRDGFHDSDFHGRCGNHTNTLIVILDESGSIFGGFTPVKWERHLRSKSKTDESQKSFLFTLKNPNNISARKFPLKAGMQYYAINREWDRTPSFGYDDLAIRYTESFGAYGSVQHFGSAYINDTGLDGYVVCTGDSSFDVREIEVFEITD